MSREPFVHNPLRAVFSGAFLHRISAAVLRSYTRLSPLRWPAGHWTNNCWKQQSSTHVADRLRHRYSDVKAPVHRNGPLQTAWNPPDCQCRTGFPYLQTSSACSRPHHAALPEHPAHQYRCAS